MINISEYENLERMPTAGEMIKTPWAQDWKIGEKYDGAFLVTDHGEADRLMMTYVAHTLRFGSVNVKNEKGYITGTRRPVWSEAFYAVRQDLAFYALAKDVTPFLYRMVDGVKVENTHARDHVREYFGAELPESVIGRKPDILERVHQRNERNARKRGEHYQRNVVPPVDREADNAPKQESLF